MNTSTNVHNVDKIKIDQDEADGTKWVNISLIGEMGCHRVTVFQKDLSDFQHAIEVEGLHKKSDIIEASEVGYII